MITKQMPTKVSNEQERKLDVHKTCVILYTKLTLHSSIVYFLDQERLHFKVATTVINA